MSQSRAIEHFLHYLPHHPALAGNAKPRLLLGCTGAYQHLADEILKHADDRYHVHTLHLELTPGEAIVAALHACDLFIFFYDASTLSPPPPQGPTFLAPLQATMTRYWKKSILFKDYGPYFNDAFAIAPQRIADLNSALIRRLSQARTLSFRDDHGSSLSVALESIEQWTDINGLGNYDLTPGEVASHSEAINGQVNFIGTFLGTIPFARKYGLLQAPLQLWIEHSTICRIATTVPGLEADFNRYLEANPSNRRIEELGIGTNEGVKRLYGRNAGFEERHCGLHLGLGGGARGSHHLDLIFSEGTLALDGNTVFDGRFTV